MNNCEIYARRVPLSIMSSFLSCHGLESLLQFGSNSSWYIQDFPFKLSSSCVYGVFAPKPMWPMGLRIRWTYKCWISLNSWERIEEGEHVSSFIKKIRRHVNCLGDKPGVQTEQQPLTISGTVWHGSAQCAHGSAHGKMCTLDMGSSTRVHTFCKGHRSVCTLFFRPVRECAYIFHARHPVSVESAHILFMAGPVCTVFSCPNE